MHVDDLEAFALVGGALPPDRVAAIVDHADSCRECHELIEGLCQTETVEQPSASLDALVGIEVAGYRIDAAIAAGGMGVVYRATDLASGQGVALKVPRSQAPVLMRRFEREVSITARLAHDGIVPILARGTFPDGTAFYVMPIIEGISLDVAVDRARYRAERLALVPHLAHVARTMAFVHAQGIVHRDLKPQNVLITRSATLVIDWGLAKVLTSREPGRAAASEPPARAPVAPAVQSSVPPQTNRSTSSIAQVLAGRTTRPGDVFGTPAFMAPEQARGEPVDERADIYAIGAMLEQLLTGRLPRKAALAALAQAPADLVDVCRRATAADPRDRYANCGELASALARRLSS